MLANGKNVSVLLSVVLCLVQLVAATGTVGTVVKTTFVAAPLWCVSDARQASVLFLTAVDNVPQLYWL
jgi:hypothetical protein